MLKRLNRAESRTAVPSMAALGCRREMDLGRRKRAELDLPGAELCVKCSTRDRPCSRAPQGHSKEERIIRRVPKKSQAQNSLKPCLCSGCAQQLHENPGNGGEKTCTHHPHLIVQQDAEVINVYGSTEASLFVQS